MCEVVSCLHARATRQELGSDELVRCFFNKKLQVGVVERTPGGLIIEIFIEFKIDCYVVLVCAAIFYSGFNFSSFMVSVDIYHI